MGNVDYMPVKKKANEKGFEDVLKLKTINEVLNRGSLENLLAYGSSRDNEAASENAADSLLNQIEKERNNSHDITIIENLTNEGPKGERITKKKSITFTSGSSKKPRIKRDIHFIKHIKPRSNPRSKNKNKPNRAAASSKKVKRHKSKR